MFNFLKSKYRIKLRAFDEEFRSPDNIYEFVNYGGIHINETIYARECSSDVFTYIFSKRLSLNHNLSLMNVNFLRLIQHCAGSLYWTDDEEKSLHLYFDNEFNDKVAWSTNIAYIAYSKIYGNPKAEELKTFMNKVEQYLKNIKGIIDPKIVITFENRFLLKHQYKIIDTNFDKISDLGGLPSYSFPYNKSII